MDQAKTDDVLSSWRVVSVDERTGLIALDLVHARDELAAFKAAALLRAESEEAHEERTFVCAVPGDVEVSFPGEGVVYMETILEDDDVFPRGAPAPSAG